MTEHEDVNVGVACILKHDGTVLYGKRRSDHGEGTWCVPGGHLEHGESITDCARREVREETGLDVTDLQIATVTNDIFDSGEHYVTIWVTGDASSDDAERREPEKCAEWRWYDWNDPPQPLFLPDRNLRKTAFHPFR